MFACLSKEEIQYEQARPSVTVAICNAHTKIFVF